MKPKKITPREIGFYILILVILVGIVYALTNSVPANEYEIKDYSEVRRIFDKGNVEYFVIEDNVLTITLKEPYVVGTEKYDTVYHELFDISIFYTDCSEDIDRILAENSSKDFNYNYKPSIKFPWWISIIPYAIIIVAFVVIWGIMANRSGLGGDKGVAKFGKARTKLGSEEKKKVTFADVAGADEEKEELAEIVDFLKHPQKYTALGARIPKGVLLVGPPGTGKTLIAKAVAGEANTQFLSISGSDFVELYVGVGASRVRDLFDQAKKLAPAIIFIDEIDAVGRQRGTGLGGGHDEREQTLNQLLVEMDGFSNNEGVIVMAATNRADILDNALLRPGRFDRQIYVGVPDVKGREAILRVHAKGKMLGDDIDLNSVARGTPGFTGADLENLLNEAALLAARRNKRFITMAELDEASLKVLAGPEKKSRLIPEKARKLTAYHEAGHAVAAFFCKNTDPVHYITIIPRGMAGGLTLQRPADDKAYTSKSEMFEDIVVCLGGRIAEKLMLDDISTGASSDIQHATHTARQMVTVYGMSDKLGPISFDDSSHSVFIGRDFSQTKSYSEQTAALIDEEVKRLFDEAQVQCEKLLTDHNDLLIKTAEYLLEHESMEGDVFKYLCENGELPPEPEKPEEVPAPEVPAEEIPVEEAIPVEAPAEEIPSEPTEEKPEE